MKDCRSALENTDHSQSDRTLKTNAAKFLPTLKGFAATLANITRHIGKLVDEWPGPSVISKICKSDCLLWLAQYPDLRPVNRNKMIRAADPDFREIAAIYSSCR